MISMIGPASFATVLLANVVAVPCHALSAPQLESAVRPEVAPRSPERKMEILAEAGQPGSPPPAANEPRPIIAKDAPYGAVRENLLAAGWQPFISPDADKCWEGDRRCQGRPEKQACAGTGVGNCLFLWRKGNAVLAVFTVGEPPIISEIECRTGCL